MVGQQGRDGADSGGGAGQERIIPVVRFHYGHGVAGPGTGCREPAGGFDDQLRKVPDVVADSGVRGDVERSAEVDDRSAALLGEDVEVGAEIGRFHPSSRISSSHPVGARPVTVTITWVSQLFAGSFNSAMAWSSRCSVIRVCASIAGRRWSSHSTYQRAASLPPRTTV